MADERAKRTHESSDSDSDSDTWIGPMPDQAVQPKKRKG